MKIFSKVKNYAFPIVCGVLLFVLVFSRSETVKAAPLAGGNSDVGIYWLSNMGGVWVDDTADANDSDAAGDVDWSISVGTRPMYIGHLTTKFNKVILDVSLPVDELQNGKDLPVFYWDGANWVDLPLDAQTHPLDTVGVNSFSFSAPADWEITTVNGVDAYYIRFGTSGDAFAVNNAQVSQISLQTVTPPGVTVTESGGSTTLTEAGATDTYTIVLNAAPASAVTLAVTPDAYSTVSTSSIHFSTTNWDTPVTVTVTAVNNNVAEGTHTSTITHTASSIDVGYDNIAIASVTSTITDNDTAGVTIAETGASTAVTEGGTTDEITVVLTSAPTSTVTVSLTPNSQITLSTSSIEFSAANWNVPVTSTISAVNDSSVEGNHTGSILYAVASSNWNYNGITVASTSVTITDNDVAATDTPSNSNSVSAPAPAPVLSSPTGPTNVSTPAAPPVAVNLDANKPVFVSVGGESHTITQVGAATANQITIIIRSEPITVTLLKNSPQEVDTDKDGTADVKLLYKGLSGGQPQMEVTALTEAGESMKPVSISSGAETTSVRDVKITLRAQNVDLIAVSEDPTFAGGSFIAYAPTVNWTLSPGVGVKTVYVRFRSPQGGTVDASDSIVLQAANTKTCSLTVGKVYKYKNAPGIYYIVGPRDLVPEAGNVPCTKRPFKNPRTYFSYFTSYSEAKVVESKTLDAIPNDPLKFMAFGPLEKLQENAVVKQIVNSRVYILKGNKLHWIQNEQVFNAMGLKWNAIQDISSGLFDKFIEGTPISSATDPLVR